MIDVDIQGRIRHRNLVILMCYDIITDLLQGRTYKDVVITVEVVTECDGQEAGLCYQHDDEIEITLARRSYGEPYTFDEMMIALCHELVHAKQFILGELSDGSWHGKKLDTFKNLPPWEEEAHRLEEVLYDKYKAYFI